MRILVGIAHPKHVHIFKNFIRIMRTRGHEILAIAVEKEIVLHLMKMFDYPYRLLGHNQPTLLKKLSHYPFRVFNGLRYAIKFRPDIIIGQADPLLAVIKIFLNKPFVAFPDTENAPLMHRFAIPFADAIITSDSFNMGFGDKHIRINSYLENAYLNPKYFIPKKDIFNELCIYGEKFVLMRFVSWHSHHDFGHLGITLENKIKAVNEFSKYASVFISSEEALPAELAKFRIRIAPEHIHSVLYHAALLYGESATMASEAALLGTPAIYLNNVGTGYTQELESKYGLLFNYTESLESQNLSIEKGIELLKANKIKEKWKKLCNKVLSEKIDITTLMVWIIENYPESLQKIKENPDYQKRFINKNQE